MAKTKGVVLGANHVNHVGPAGAFIGDREGFTPGTPQGTKSTVLPQFRGGGINTKANEVGTPLQDVDGNPDEFSRTAEGTGRYGVARDPAGVDMNSRAATGRGVALDVGPLAGGSVPRRAAMIDSPVPTGAPRFGEDFISAEDKAHLGSGNESAADPDLRKGGVMGR